MGNWRGRLAYVGLTLKKIRRKPKNDASGNTAKTKEGEQNLNIQRGANFTMRLLGPEETLIIPKGREESVFSVRLNCWGLGSEKERRIISIPIGRNGHFRGESIGLQITAKDGVEENQIQGIAGLHKRNSQVRKTGKLGGGTSRGGGEGKKKIERSRYGMFLNTRGGYDVSALSRREDNTGRGTTE